MRTRDVFASAFGAAAGNPLRTFLLTLAMAIGGAAVVVLTALGDGARRYVVREFTDMGSALVVVLPGKVETQGSSKFVSTYVRDLTLADADALRRSVPAARRVAPLAFGTSDIEFGTRARQVMVLGATPEMLDVRNLSVAAGRLHAALSVGFGENLARFSRRCKENRTSSPSTFFCDPR